MPNGQQSFSFRHVLSSCLVRLFLPKAYCKVVALLREAFPRNFGSARPSLGGLWWVCVAHLEVFGIRVGYSIVNLYADGEVPSPWGPL